MRVLGLIGGMSWESTLLYYRLLNEYVKKQLGGLHSAPCLIHSVDFAPIALMQNENRWDDASQVLCKAALGLQNSGAEAILICANTMHKVAPAVQRVLSIPLLHIVDATATRIESMGLKKVLLLGTRYTMEDSFYRDHLRENYAIEAMTPALHDRDFVHATIYNELCRGEIRSTSRDRFISIIDGMQTQGVEAVILGCTELTLLVDASQTKLPVIDSTALHVQFAADWAFMAESVQP